MARRSGRGRSATTARSNFGFRRFTRERPLLVVAAGVLVGMTFGALLPWSRLEDEFGEDAERLKDGALDLASDGFERVKSVAQRTYESATEKLRGGQSNGDAGENTSPQSGQTTATYGTDPYRG